MRLWQVALYLLCVNGLSTLLMYIDKKRAKKRRRRRVRERTLLVLTALGGGLGTWIAMTVLRHKTKHASFRILTPSATIGWGILLLWLLYQGWLLP